MHIAGRAHSALVASCILLLSAGLLAGCGPGGTRPITKFGLQAPFMGFDESLGYSVIGQTRLAAIDRNLADSAGGYSIEPVALDDANLPGTAAQRAREMIIDPAIMAVVGGFDGAATQSAAAEYATAGMPFVTLSSSDALSTALRLTATDSAAGQRAAQFATQTLGARRLVMLSEAAPGADSLGDAFAEAARAGGAAVSRIPITRWQLDFSNVITQVQTAAPDMVFFGGRAAEAGEFLRQRRTAGGTAAFLGGPGTDDVRLSQIAGPAAQGAYYVSLGYPLSEVEDPALRAKLEASAARPAGPYTALAYDGAQIVIDAIARAAKSGGRLTRRSVGEALRSDQLRGRQRHHQIRFPGTAQGSTAGHLPDHRRRLPWSQGLPAMIVPLRPDDVHRIWLAPETHFTVRLLRQHLEQYPHLAWMVSESGDYIVGGYWKNRLPIGLILETSPSSQRGALAERLLRSYRETGSELVVISEHESMHSLRLYQDMGFGVIENVVCYEKPDMQSPPTPRRLTIRRLQESDLPALVQLEQQTFPWLWWELASAFAQSDRRPDTWVLVALLDNELAGYLILAVRGVWGHINRIGVRPQLQGQGLGRELLAVAIEELAGRGARTIGLNTQSDNTRSQRLYEGFGFVRTGETFRIYGKWLDERATGAR